jgi:hypothetical protein
MTTPDWPERKEWVDDYTGPSYDYTYVKELERRYAILHRAMTNISTPADMDTVILATMALIKCPPLPKEKEGE